MEQSEPDQNESYDFIFIHVIPQNFETKTNNFAVGLLLPRFLGLGPEVRVPALPASCCLRGVRGVAFHAYLLVKQSCVSLWESCHFQHLGLWRMIKQSLLNDF